jgi:hypothetical protein
MKPEGSQLLRWRPHLAYFNVANMTWLTCFTNDHISAPFVVITIRSFPHSWFITGFVTTVTRRMPLVEQELNTLPEQPSSPSVFCVGSCCSVFSFLCSAMLTLVCFLSFWSLHFHSSIYDFWFYFLFKKIVLRLRLEFYIWPFLT